MTKIAVFNIQFLKLEAITFSSPKKINIKRCDNDNNFETEKELF